MRDRLIDLDAPALLPSVNANAKRAAWQSKKVTVAVPTGCVLLRRIASCQSKMARPVVS